MKKIISTLLSLVLLAGCGPKNPQPTVSTPPSPSASPAATAVVETLAENGTYDAKDEVAEYIVTYHKLPENYMTKKEARERGWESGALCTVVKGMAIGGDYFGNYEGILPEEKGREYYECDIDTIGKKSRGAKRIIYTEDGWNVYYTEDHYETFEHLYGDDDYEG